MNSITNQVQLIGNLGADVEMKTIANGAQLASISLATTEYYKNNKGELVKNTQWHRLTAWGNTAKYMSEQLTKGMKVAIRGSLAYSSYEGKDNIKRQVTNIKVNEFVRLSPSTSASAIVDGGTAAVPQGEDALPF